MRSYSWMRSGIAYNTWDWINMVGTRENLIGNWSRNWWWCVWVLKQIHKLFIVSLRNRQLVTCMRSNLRFIIWLRWRSGFNLSCNDIRLIFVEVGMAMILIAKINYVANSIIKYAHSRRIIGVIETTFMLKIWFMCNIYQNKIIYNNGELKNNICN